MHIVWVCVRSSTYTKFTRVSDEGGVQCEGRSGHQRQCPHASEHHIHNWAHVEVREIEHRHLRAKQRRQHKLAVPDETLFFASVIGDAGPRADSRGSRRAGAHELEHAAVGGKELEVDGGGVDDHLTCVVQVQCADQVHVERVEVPTHGRVVKLVKVRLVEEQTRSATHPVLEIQEQVRGILHTIGENLLREVVACFLHVVMSVGSVAAVGNLAAVILQRVWPDGSGVIRVH